MSEPETHAARSLGVSRPALALAVIIVGYIVINAITGRLMQSSNRDNDWYFAIFYGVLIFEPISFGIWSALGMGRFLTRLPLAMACLGIVLVAFGLTMASVERVERIEFIALALSATVVSTSATALFAIVRSWTGRRIDTKESTVQPERRPVRFSVKYLLLVTTLVALALGMASQLELKNSTAHMFFGPEFVLYVMIVGGAITAGLSLPTVALPWFLLSGEISRRGLRFAAGFWFAVTIIAGLYFAMEEVDAFSVVVGYILLMQFGAGIAGALAAVPLRVAGLRLVRGRPHHSQTSVADNSIAAKP